MNRSPLTTLLVANRGEIACRVMRTAKAMGLTTVAVHSAIDRNARHSREADLSVDLGGNKAADSYLQIDKLVAAAKASGAQAIHPGYGFLSENPDFARAVEAAGLIFLGPPASAIDAMGSKSAAKALMEAAGVPLVPGYHGQAQDLDTFKQAARHVGYPVLLKASAGGGGKGMKVVEDESQLADALASAQREALSSFGDARMLVEKYVLKPRHVEIQIFADRQGHCLYLNERDCSIQRRHQKVVEEAPAPGLSADLRRAMGEAAVRAAQAIGYVGAGTVEFLLDARGEFFFMEMNTRLQVEHPVTEAITGLDLVAWQIRVACGEPLPITQDQVPLNGHAIEVRLYAEDPANDFLPATGTLTLYREPACGAGRRVDSGVSEGDAVSPFYDPMLGKLIAWGEDREQARLRLLAMLDEFAVGGVKTNIAFLRRILAHPAFAAAELDTGFIPRHQEALLPTAQAVSAECWEAAAQAWLQSAPPCTRPDDPHSPWAQRDGLRLGAGASTTVHLTHNGHDQAVTLNQKTQDIWSLQGDWLVREQSGLRTRHLAIRRGASLYLHWDGEFYTFEAFDPVAEAAIDLAYQGGLTAPMNGSIVRVLVEVGQAVEAGAPLVVLEAMKMEHSIRAPKTTTVKALLCQEGDMVSEGAALVELES
ncbi:acetyl/propionyl/methylcrotonyl-CoA carboxylase subunit alpha [Pseudomonas putida]|uniref:acetyl/propionyl/methylcrotonyl-CoA carboxylase subunit alpha n=1 Tax=Pseudomonas putida TaxID=303 RepID=UPI0018E6D605|nr:acetyl/propionyl/methylcrotonyl-CoA carboxylase subunit alpha [Pseudomonas putida]MBI6923716.1 acetyl/propionyl/methylcrotonyl-CoA carboxylase subunit alpha [Pseudomonas putida]